MLTVVALNWNDYLGRGMQYVTRMRNMVERNLTVPHEFIEVTERDIRTDKTGWFVKLDLLRMFPGDVLYLDLDVVITANIDALVRLAQTDRTKIWARDDWSYSIVNPQSGREATINSSVLLWSGYKDLSRLTPAMLRDTHGDQGIITQLFWPAGIGLLPNHLVQSYKYGMCRNGEPPAPIVVMHGEPKNHQIEHEPFVQEHWR